MEKETEAKLYIIKNNLQQRKELLCLYLKLEFEKVGVGDGVGGVIAWVTCVSWVAHYFSNSFLKPAKKRIQLYFLEFSLDI